VTRLPRSRPGFDQAGAGILRPMRTMYALYWFVIVAGILAYTLTGLHG
jgi:hypothetical protein